MQLLNRIQQKTSFNNILIIACILVISGISIVGLLHKGFFLTDDGNWMVIRFSAFYEAFRSGQFPVRFLPRLNNGYGYPVADFLYPLFMYIGVPIHLLGFSFVSTIKIIFGLSLLLSSLFSFLWLKKQFSLLAAFIGGIIFTFFPYHLWDIYKRGNIGEAIAFPVVAFSLWQAERKDWRLIALGIALLIASHNTLALLFLPIVIIYCLLKKISIKYIVLSLSFGLLISAFFWIPALYDKQFTIFDVTQVSNIANYFLTLQMLPIVGIIFIAIFGMSMYLFLKNKNRFQILFLSVAIISVFLTLPFSNFIWNIVPGKQFIQFPFRFLSLTTIACAFLGAYIINSVRHTRVWFTVLIILVVISAWNYLYPTSFVNFPDSFYSTNQDSTTVQNEYMPKWVTNLPSSQSLVLNKDTKINVSNFTGRGTNISFLASSEDKTNIILHLIYFPGWNAVVDGKNQEILYPHGLITIPIEKGDHRIHLYFSETPIRIIADALSLIGIIIVFLSLVFKIKHEK